MAIVHSVHRLAIRFVSETVQIRQGGSEMWSVLIMCRRMTVWRSGLLIS